MKAIVCKTFGPPESLVLEDVPSRPLGKNEVRIAVKAAGVNFPDTLIIQGKYQLKAEPPFTPGAEVAGTVIEAGEKVKNVRAGDPAVALVPTGGYAEEVVASAEMVMPLPRDMDFKDGEFRASKYVRLHLLRSHIREKRLSDTLEWMALH